MFVACGKRIIFEEHFAEVFEVVLDELQFIDDILRVAAAELVAVECLRNHAVAAVVRASATRQDDNERVQVRTVEILLVAAVKVLAVNFRNPRNFVQVLDLRAFGLEIDFAFGRAVCKTCELANGSAVATEGADEVPAGVVCFADDDVVKRRFHFHRFERFRRGVCAHDGDLHVRHFFLDGVNYFQVVQNTRRARAANDKFRAKFLDAFKRLGQVKFHGGAVYQLDFVAISFANAGCIT